MSYAALKEESVHLFNEYPFLTSIRDEQDYKQALELIEELLEEKEKSLAVRVRGDKKIQNFSVEEFIEKVKFYLNASK